MRSSDSLRSSSRLAILPWCPIPYPFIPDDFSFLLAADTFASGRLTNPTPAMWMHFESIHITMKPTYMSMYFPAQGLVLAAGKVLIGHPWFGILVMTATHVCSHLSGCCRRGFRHPGRLLGGTARRPATRALFSYWINSYSGAGSISALGGALVLGALPRFMKTARLRDGLLMAAGVSTSRHLSALRWSASLSPRALFSGVVDVLWKEPASSPATPSPYRSPVGADRSSRCVDGLLQLPRVWKSHDTALHRQPRPVCDGALFRMASPAP